MEIKKDILWRVYLCFLGIAGFGIMVVGKAIYIQAAEGNYWKRMGDSLHLKYVPIIADRGTIYSEDGNMLSTSVPVYDVYIDFSAEGLREKDGKKFKENLDSLSLCLSVLFADREAAAYRLQLKQAYEKKLRYYPLKKKISFSQLKELREFPLVRLGRNKSGFIFEMRDRRINPYVLLANRTIGLSRNDSTKNVGLERSYDSVLRGTVGQKLVKYVAGSYVPVEGAELEPENGKDIITTLDTYIQDVSESALMDMLVGNNSTHGTVIVMETETGKIKALANLGRKDEGVYIEDLNYGVGKRTEPGSIFKLATLLCLLEDKYVTNNTIVDCEGGAKYFYGLRIKDSHLGTGAVSVKDAFMMSSNVAFAKLAEQYYHHQPSKFTDHLHRFRLDTLTGIDIEASSGAPIIYKPSSKYWHPTNIPYMAHGYGALVTPLHMLMLYNAVANNGRMMKPYLVNEIKQYGVSLQKFSPQVVVEKICSDETIAQAKECLRAVVDSPHGTARLFVYDSGYSISGKTGTAVSAKGNQGYLKGGKIYQSSFIGYFPSEKPKYTMAVVIQNSEKSKEYYGAKVAGRVFKVISDKINSQIPGSGFYVKNKTASDTAFFTGKGMRKDYASVFNYFGLHRIDSTKGSKWSAVQFNNKTAVLKASAVSELGDTKTPDVTGMGLKDALYVLENKGFKTTVMGRGRVVSQSVAPGSVFNKGQKINILLN